MFIPGKDVGHSDRIALATSNENSHQDRGQPCGWSLVRSTEARGREQHTVLRNTTVLWEAQGTDSASTGGLNPGLLRAWGSPSEGPWVQDWGNTDALSAAAATETRFGSRCLKPQECDLCHCRHDVSKMCFERPIFLESPVRWFRRDAGSSSLELYQSAQSFCLFFFILMTDLLFKN